LAGCCACFCLALVKVKDIVEAVMSKMVKMAKKHLKALLKAKAPDWIVDKLPWNWTVETDIGEAIPKVEEKKAAGVKTQKEQKGLPERDPKAAKEAAKPPKGIAKRRKAVLAEAASDFQEQVIESVMGAKAEILSRGYEIVNQDDDESDEDWDDHDDEEDSDAYSDFDNEDGAASEDDEEEVAKEPLVS